MAGQTANTTNTTKTTKNNKNLIIAICAAVVAIVIVAVVVVILVTGKNKGGVPIGGLNDAYFTSDDTKYVLNMDAEDMYIEDEAYAPLKSHLVYTYSGDKITGLKAYYEYADASAASTAYDFYQANNDGTFKEVALDGKYLILTANAEEYENLTPEDVKQQIEFMEMLNNMDTEETESIEGVEEVNEAE